MNTEDFRIAVTQEIVSWGANDFAEVPIFYENGPLPDQDKIGPLWLDTQFRWYGGQIASVGAKPRTRHTGAIAASCYFKSAGGLAQPGKLLDALGTLLEARRISGGILWAPQKTIPTHLLGWYRSGILIPFTLG